MCVVAVAWDAHPQWRLVVAGNRDEFHARTSAPLARWDDYSDIIAGRDLVSGGTWMGVSAHGRFAVVTNIRDADGPDPNKASRGALVADWLVKGHVPDVLDGFNPFNLVVAGNEGVQFLSNRPSPMRTVLERGIHGLSNAIPDEHWPRKDRLESSLTAWLEGDAAKPIDLLDTLKDESTPDRDGYPIFINSPVYGTRCSTVIAVDGAGQGQITERRFDASGAATGDATLYFSWP